jgi:molecular chaperone GrpE
MTEEEKISSGAETETEAQEAPADEEKDWAEEARKFQDLYLRCAAETENMRRRFQKERDEISRFAGETIIRSVLPSLDNLGLALNYVRAEAPAEALNLAEGVRLTLKGLMDVLKENGLRAVPAERGQIFDPNLHEAIGQQPETELPPGTISREIQAGYALYERLIRPAKVLVATAAPEADPAAS